MASKAERQKKSLEDHRKIASADEATNKFFEARVAVMGFKCRVMQLQGELEAQRKELRENSSASVKEEIERLERENLRLKSELAEALRKGTGAPQREREDVQRRLQQQVGQLQADNQRKEQQLIAVQQEVGTLRVQMHSIQSECERLRTNNTHIHTRIQEMEQEKDQLQRELSKTRQVAEGYRGECQSLVQDYQTAGGQIRSMEAQIRALEEERDQFKRQAHMGLRELALRGERIKNLEAARKELEDKLQHMDYQQERYSRSSSYN